MKNSLILIILLFTSCGAFAQDRAALDSLPRKIRIKKDYLTPAKAAFYSAVVPGLGQIHTGRYWTLPFIYGGLGVSAYYYNFQSKRQANTEQHTNNVFGGIFQMSLALKFLKILN